MKNVFQIPNPVGSLCHLLGYHRSGSFLEIMVYPEVGDEDVFYIYFDGVVYFDGPVFWRGAGFEERTAVDCLALLRDLRVHDDLPGDDLVGKFTLYAVPMTGSNRFVRVLAIHSGMSDEPSGRFE